MRYPLGEPCRYLRSRDTLGGTGLWASPLSGKLPPALGKAGPGRAEALRAGGRRPGAPRSSQPWGGGREEPAPSGSPPSLWFRGEGRAPPLLYGPLAPRGRREAGGLCTFFLHYLTRGEEAAGIAEDLPSASLRSSSSPRCPAAPGSPAAGPAAAAGPDPLPPPAGPASLGSLAQAHGSMRREKEEEAAAGQQRRRRLGWGGGEAASGPGRVQEVGEPGAGGLGRGRRRRPARRGGREEVNGGGTPGHWGPVQGQHRPGFASAAKPGRWAQESPPLGRAGAEAGGRRRPPAAGSGARGWSRPTGRVAAGQGSRLC